MGLFLVRRLTWAVVVLTAVGTLAFLLTFVVPTEPAKVIAGRNAPAAAVERIRVALGLDRPPHEQLVDYVTGLLRGDLGVSYTQRGAPVLDLILAKLPATLELAIAGVLLALLVGLPLGVRAATRPGGAHDRTTAVIGSIMVSIPSFVVGIVLLYVVAYEWQLAPLASRRYDPLDLRALALPAITLAIATIPFYLRVSRATTLDALRSDHVRTARAKGLSERAVVWRHGFRVGMLPLLTLVGMDLAFFLGGLVIIEDVFSWPGIGQQAVKAISQEDIPVLMGTLLFATFCVVVINLVVDLIHALLDPRGTSWADER